MSSTREDWKMRKIMVALLIVVLGSSCFGTLIGQALAQSSADSTTPPPLTVRWMRYRGAITQWGSEASKGSLVVNAKTANVPPEFFKPWVTVEAFWSNEPPFPATKPTGGQYVFTHYHARLVMLISIRKQADMIVNVTGLWNVQKIVTTTDFDQNGVPIKTVNEVTPLATQTMGQLHITTDWKNFDITVNGVDPLQGIEISMMTTTNTMNPFSFEGAPKPTLPDLMRVVGCFRTVPGFAKFNPELDYNGNSKIDIADLTTVAANM
jgi:hypothetical protein